MDEKIDPEDILECDCFIITLIKKNECGENVVYYDRVYRNRELCKLRIDYLNKISNGRGEWFSVYSQLGK